MYIQLDSVLRFPMSCPYRQQVVQDLILTNPKHTSAKAFSPRPAKEIPEKLFYFNDDYQNLTTTVPIGKKDLLFQYCAVCPNKCPVYDNRTIGQNIQYEGLAKVFTPRASQAKALEAIQNSISRMGNGLVVMPTGCHAKGTKILMFDGSWKNVEDVLVGDQLMGPDSKPRNVLSLARGKEQMYKIIPTKGESFVVNKNHILSLVKTNERGENSKRSHHGSYKNLTDSNGVINITVSDYLQKSKHFKHLFKLYRPDAVEFNEKPITIDPYFLGLLLGDGSLQNCVGLTTMDDTLVDEVKIQAIKYNLQINIQTKLSNKASSYYLTNPQSLSRTKKNELREAIKDLNLQVVCDNKFIPDNYKINNPKIRLELLAGLIDSDGHVIRGKSCEITFKSKRLSDDVKFLAQSLGFLVTQKIKVVNGVEYYRCHINGDLSEIPTRLERKKFSKREQIKNHLYSGFIVEYINIDNYFGFQVDDDNLYIIEDFWVTHNSGKSKTSFITSYMSKKPTLFITHTLDLAEQAYDDYADMFGIKPGFIGDGRYEINPQFTVAIIDTIYLRKIYQELSEIFGLVIFDEVHMMAPESCVEVANSLSIKYKIGFTATLERGDGLTPVILSCFGQVVYQVSIEEVQKEGSLVPLQFFTLPTNYVSPYDQDKLKAKKSLVNAAIKEASLDMDRNKIVANHVIDLCQYGHSILLVLQSIDQCLLVCELLQNQPNVRPELFVGQVGKKKFKREERKEIINRAKSGETNVLVSVQLAGVGLDVPRLTCLVMDRKISDPSSVEQIVGRVVRTCPDINKQWAYVFDVEDVNVPLFQKQTQKRFYVYNKFRKYN